MSGKVLPLVTRIAEAGFLLLDYEFRNLGEADAEEIYRTNTPIRDGAQWHAARRVYEMGVSVGLLFGVDGNEDACTRMYSLKGRSNPMLTSRGELRHDFRAPNRSLSLMHSSDDEARVMREAAVFFSPARLQHVKEWMTGTLDIEERTLSALSSAHHHNAGIERIHVPRIWALFASVRVRLALHLSDCFGPQVDEQHRNAISKYAHHWSAPRNLGNTENLPIPEQVAAYLEHVEAEQTLVRAVLDLG